MSRLFGLGSGWSGFVLLLSEADECGHGCLWEVR